MATFTKRGTKWRAQVRKRGINRSAEFKTKSEAIYWASQLEREIESGNYNSIPDLPFSYIIEKYIKEVTPTKKSARKETFRLQFLLTLPIATISLRELNDNHFRQWRDDRLKTVSNSTVLREWGTISHIINTAIVEWKLLTNNPLKLVKKPTTPKPRNQRYSDEDIEKILYVSGFSWNSRLNTASARVGAALLFAIETAMRAGEICNLTWEHVNFETRIAHLTDTKNGWPRDVPLSSQAVKILKMLEVIAEGELVFQLNAPILDALFRKIKKKCMIEDLHFHDTRREALTRLAEKVDVMTLAKISGHRDLSILQNTYYAPDMKKVVNLLH